VLHLAGSHALSHRDIAEVRLEVFQTAYDIAGGGRFGDKAAPRTKEQADYNLKYLAAVALIDGQVGPDQLREDRVRRDDVQSLLRRVEVVADDSLTAGYPRAMPVRVHIGLTDGRRWSREQTDFEGAATRPLSWDRVVQKFHWLTEPYADDVLRADIIAAVADLDTISIATLTALLARVRSTCERPRTHHPL
jgi:2-methylcitrate dehydratase